MKYWFKNDYSFGAHPQIMNAVIAANLQGNIGYGFDEHTQYAKDIIREKCGLPNAMVEFMIGGTQTNVVACSFMLRQWEAVICANSAHINGHEAGAFESTGHKLLQVEVGIDGKLTPELIAPLLEIHKDVHLTKPKLVYISNATETGEVYTKAELMALSKFCKSNNLYLFADGARLGAALTSKSNDLTLSEFASFVDLFYIGGTKNGLMYGEALVIKNVDLCEDFFRMKKQMGAVMAKGWIQGVMFKALFEDDLFYKMASNANEMAEKLQYGLINLGFKPWIKSPTNQLFFIIPNKVKSKLNDICECEDWCVYDNNHMVVRFVTSFKTSESDVDGLIESIKNIVLKSR